MSALSEICSPSHHGPGPMLLIAVLDLHHRRVTVHQIRPPNGLARSQEGLGGSVAMGARPVTLRNVIRHWRGPPVLKLPLISRPPIRPQMAVEVSVFAGRRRARKRTPEPCAQVRILLGAPCWGRPTTTCQDSL